jgi:DNA polymerase III sliding clamp (beta) subunit (PCNA family)
MGVNLSINCNLIKEVVKAVEHTNDDAVFVFDNSGFFIRVSDIYKYKVLEIKISSNDLLEYECSKPVELGIVINRLKDITKTMRKGDSLIMKYDDTSDYLQLVSNGLKRSIKLVDLNHISRIPNLDLHYKYRAIIDHKTFNSFIKACGKALSFKIITDKDNMVMVCETDEGLIEVPWDDSVKTLEDGDSYESNTTFALSEVAKAVSTSKGLISVEGTQDKVVCFSWDLANDSKIKAMIAPKV